MICPQALEGWLGQSRIQILWQGPRLFAVNHIPPFLWFFWILKVGSGEGVYVCCFVVGFFCYSNMTFSALISCWGGGCSALAATDKWLTILYHMFPEFSVWKVQSGMTASHSAYSCLKHCTNTGQKKEHLANARSLQQERELMISVVMSEIIHCFTASAENIFRTLRLCALWPCAK